MLSVVHWTRRCRPAGERARVDPSFRHHAPRGRLISPRRKFIQPICIPAPCAARRWRTAWPVSLTGDGGRALQFARRPRLRDGGGDREGWVGGRETHPRPAMSLSFDALDELARLADLYEEHAKKLQRLQLARPQQHAASRSAQARISDEGTVERGVARQQAAGRIDKTRLMIYSSDTPDIDDFAMMIRCQKARYEFDTDGVDRFRQIIAHAVAENSGKPLKSIALACHGPPPDADGEADHIDGPDEIFHWPIAKAVVVTDDTDLIDKSHPARQVVDALAGGVELESGRVDLLACSLLKSREGQEVFDAIERETQCNFAASNNATGNPRDGGDWVMESDNVDIREFYFWDTDAFDGRFAAGNLGLSPGRLTAVENDLAGKVTRQAPTAAANLARPVATVGGAERKTEQQSGAGEQLAARAANANCASESTARPHTDSGKTQAETIAAEDQARLSAHSTGVARTAEQQPRVADAKAARESDVQGTQSSRGSQDTHAAHKTVADEAHEVQNQAATAEAKTLGTAAEADTAAHEALQLAPAANEPRASQPNVGAEAARTAEQQLVVAKREAERDEADTAAHEALQQTPAADAPRAILPSVGTEVTRTAEQQLVVAKREAERDEADAAGHEALQQAPAADAPRASQPSVDTEVARTAEQQRGMRPERDEAAAEADVAGHQALQQAPAADAPRASQPSVGAEVARTAEQQLVVAKLEAEKDVVVTAGGARDAAAGFQTTSQKHAPGQKRDGEQEPARAAPGEHKPSGNAPSQTSANKWKAAREKLRAAVAEEEAQREVGPDRRFPLFPFIYSY